MGTFLGCLGIIVLILVVIIVALIWGVCELFWPIVAIAIVYGIFRLASTKDKGTENTKNLGGE